MLQLNLGPELLGQIGLQLSDVGVARRRGANIRKLETDLAEKLGAKVQLQHAANGKGKVVINYNSLDELDGILDHIK